MKKLLLVTPQTSSHSIFPEKGSLNYLSLDLWIFLSTKLGVPYTVSNYNAVTVGQLCRARRRRNADCWNEGLQCTGNPRRIEQGFEPRSARDTQTSHLWHRAMRSHVMRHQLKCWIWTLIPMIRMALDKSWTMTAWIIFYVYIYKKASIYQSEAKNISIKLPIKPTQDKVKKPDFPTPESTYNRNIKIHYLILELIKWI